MVSVSYFCTLKDGRRVSSYRLENKYHEYAEILDYGASVQAVTVRDCAGNLGDVVLGADPERLEECTYVGGTIGRCANRIAHGKYCVDGKEYQLETNVGGHFLHGGSGNYAHRMFEASIMPEKNGVNLHYYDRGEGGFDCNADVNFFFSFDDNGRLVMELRMKSEGTTIMNPTNHTYFNLSGGLDVRKTHTLQIISGTVVTRDSEGLPDGGIRQAEASCDYCTEKKIWDAMTVEDYDEFYVLGGRRYREAAVLTCPQNGRKMRVETDMPGLVLFLNGKRKPEIGKKGMLYEGYCGICLETGFLPNAVNCPAYDQPVFRKGEELIAKTVYAFSA